MIALSIMNKNELIKVNDINVGEVVYRIEDNYDDVYRISNYDYHGVTLIHALKSKKGDKEIYVDKKTFLQEYIKIDPMAYIEIAAVKNNISGVKDLRVSVGVNDETCVNIIGAGLLLDWTENEFGEITQGNIGFEDSDNFYYNGFDYELFDNEVYSVSDKYRILIAYYFNDSYDSLLRLVNIDKLKLLEKYTDYIYNKYDESVYLDTGEKYITKNRFDIKSMLAFNYTIPAILSRFGLEMIEDINDVICEDHMFCSDETMEEIMYENMLPNHPYFVTEYKLYMDLNNIKNEYQLLYSQDTVNPDNYKVYICMTLKNQDRFVSIGKTS